ncbi:AraC family transcriptional regulator [Rivularia sp. IAM M-261]|nr:AraC family transcriptional regulator [Rivularia sp. IAM M-261]
MISQISQSDCTKGFSETITEVPQHHETQITEIYPEHEYPLEFYFKFKSDVINNVDYASIKVGDTALCGCGTAPKMLFTMPKQNQDIDIHIEPELLKKIFGIQEDAIPELLKHLFRQPDEEYSISTGTITTQMQVVLQQISQCPFEGLVKKVYLEAKVLELMALRLQQDMTREIIQCHEYEPKRTVAEQIYQAKEILETRLNNPPSLVELAEEVGLSLYQLKHKFRKVFGKSVFQYLHQYRMEQARLMLYDGNMLVADVANSVGYSHFGQFSAAFKRMFGISPRDCLKGKI